MNMHRPLLSSLALALLTTVVASVGAQSLGPAQIAARTVENDLSVRQAELALEEAYRGYLSRRADFGPSLTFNGSPLYGYGADTRADDSGTHTVDLGLAYRRSLPAGSSLSADVSNKLTADSGQYTHDPSSSLSYTLPIFVNGKLIEPALTGAGYRGNRLSYRKEQGRAVDGRNDAVIGALQNYVSVIERSNTVANLEEEIALEREVLEQLEITRQQGLTDLSEVWEAEISLQAKEDTLFQRSQELSLEERALAARIGANDEVDAEALSPELPSVTFDDAEIRAAAIDHQLAAARIDVEAAELGAVNAARQFGSTLTLSVSAAPSHDSDFAADSLGGSFAELAAPDGLEFGGSLGLTVPILRGGKREHQSALSTTRIRRAELALEQRRSQITTNLDQRFLEASLAAERVRYLERTVELDRRRLEEALQLFEFQTVSELDVRRARLQLHGRENELWKARADLMLSRLRILRLAGAELVEVIGN